MIDANINTPYNCVKKFNNSFARHNIKLFFIIKH